MQSTRENVREGIDIMLRELGKPSNEIHTTVNYLNFEKGHFRLWMSPEHGDNTDTMELGFYGIMDDPTPYYFVNVYDDKILFRVGHPITRRFIVPANIVVDEARVFQYSLLEDIQDFTYEDFRDILFIYEKCCERIDRCRGFI